MSGPESALHDGIAACLSAEPTLDELTAAIATVRAEPAAQWALLRALRDDDPRLTEVAKASCWHPNGFAKIVLHEAVLPRFRMRLHVWPAADLGVAPRGETNAHSHRWDFASTVICGAGLEVQHFVQHPDGLEHDRFRWGPELDGLQPAGTATLRSSPVVVRPAGDVYRCDTSVVHTAEPLGRGLVATLVLQGADRASVTEVYRRPDQAPDRPPRDLAKSELCALLDTTLAEL
ncbi:hypothetical protein [Actinomycetospora aeridis]|uniref:Uncharacterized protein n=1 Tax=Actinomycetospora aeridis TaxID=3129231 RepID=A0ABU8NC90_9PSEU